MVIMLAFAALALSVNGEFCYKEVKQACGPVGAGGTVPNCTAHYSGVDKVLPELERYTATHISQNFQYLLMSAYFNNYKANRPGLSKLYRKLADDAWEDTLDLVKYMAKRGFNMNYDVVPKKKVDIKSYQMNELASLGAALDMQKILAEEAHFIHSETTVRKTNYHDAETINFLEKEFVGKHADNIRALAGHTNDLHKLIADNQDPSLAIYIFDEHLEKVVG